MARADNEPNPIPGAQAMARPQKDIEPDESMTDEVMTAAETAAFLKIHRATLYRMIEAEGIPCHRLGNDRRFIRSEVLAWLASR
jgi:excisionase family DNA binding protein